MASPSLLARLRAAWRFFRLRYRANLEHPTPLAPEQRRASARRSLAILLPVAAIELLYGVLSERWYLLLLAASMAGLAWGRISVIRQADRESRRDGSTRRPKSRRLT